MRIAIAACIHGNCDRLRGRLRLHLRLDCRPTDGMLWRPASLNEFAGQTAAAQPIFDTVREMAEAARGTLGEHRKHLLRDPPLAHSAGSMTLVHASPGNPRRAPAVDAPDATLAAT